MIRQLQDKALALTGLATALTAALMAFQVMSPEVGAGVNGLIAAALAVIRSFVSPVAKTAVLLDKPVDVVNELLGKVKL